MIQTETLNKISVILFFNGLKSKHCCMCYSAVTYSYTQ